MIKEQKQHIKELKSQYKKDKQYFAVLADCLFEYGQGKEAEKILKQNLPDYPDYVTALMIWGKILYYKKNYEAAKEVFLKVTKLNNKCVRAYKFLGDIELKLDNREGYLSFYTEILRYDAFSTNAKNVITLLGKKYDFATEDDLISKYYSDQNIELANQEQQAFQDGIKKESTSQRKNSVQSDLEKKLTVTKSHIDLGNVNYKDAIKEIDQHFVRNKKADLPKPAVNNQPKPMSVDKEKSYAGISVKDEPQKSPVITKNNELKTLTSYSKLEELTKSKVDEFFQDQLSKPDKIKADNNISKDKPLFQEIPIKTAKQFPVNEKTSEINTVKTEKKGKKDSFSDVEAMFEHVTSTPSVKPKVTGQKIETAGNAIIQEDKNLNENSVPKIDVNNQIIIEPTAETKPADNQVKTDFSIQFVDSKEIEQEKKKSLKDYYQPIQTQVDHEAEFDLVEDIRKSGEFDSLDDMMRHHALKEKINAMPDIETDTQTDEDIAVLKKHDSQQNLLRGYDDIDLVEEERVYARADDAENGEEHSGGTIQIDIDNSFKKVVLDKVIGESETPKKRSFKIATSTLGEIYAAQGEYHKAKENYYELMTKYPDNIDYRIKFINAEFNIAAIRITEELEYYKNLMDQYPDMTKYRDRFESYQNEYNNLKLELEQKIETLTKKSN